MTLTVNLPQSTVDKLRAESESTGKDVDTLVREAIEVKLAVSGRSFREIMAPVHDEFAKSGISEGELDALIGEAVSDVRTERRTARNPS